METLTRDLRYAVRMLFKSPGFTLVALLTLALGIGANTSVFSLLNAALFRRVPAAQPDRLVWVAGTAADGRRFRDLSYPEYRAFREHTSVFAGLLAYAGNWLALGSGAEPARVYGLVVTANYFDLLGLRPAQGRGFLPDEDDPATAQPVVVISDRLWRRQFGRDPAIVGKSVTVNGRSFTVIGVGPEGFTGTELGAPVEMWVPMGVQPLAMPTQPRQLTEDGAWWLRVVGRLKPGVAVAQADAAVRTIAARRAREDPRLLEHAAAVVTPISGGLDPANRREALPILVLLMLVPGLVLLIACANVANLLLSRAAARRREVGVRLALGATRGRLVRQLLTESMVLSLVGGAAGVLLSFWITDLVMALARAPEELASAPVTDVRVLVFTLGLTVVTGMVFGLAPALGATRADLVPALKDETGTVSHANRRSRLTNAFVVAQVALSLVLLVVSGLFLRSLKKATDVDPGFDARHAAALSLDLGLQGYTAERAGLFYRQLAERAAAIPGVRSVSLASVAPLSGTMWGTEVELEGEPAATGREARARSAYFSAIWPQFFRTLDIPLLAGRDFGAADVRGAPPVVIVNETFARRSWPGQNPVGKRLKLWGDDEPFREVVGVARDSKYDELTEDPRPFLYVPERQMTTVPQAMTLLVRTAGDPASAVGPLRSLLHEMDADLPLFDVRTLERQILDRLDKERGASSLLGIFGALALVLASLGLYGVMAYAVAQRTREIGVRIALGAARRDVLGLFVREGLRLCLIGVAVGVVLAAGLTRIVARFLYGVTPTDLLTFIAVALLLTGVAALASYVPALRAARVDPMVALRAE